MVLDQDTLKQLGDGLIVKYTVLDNLKLGRHLYEASIEITNSARVDLPRDNWEIYLCHIRLIEPDVASSQEKCEIKKSGVCFTHINGCLFKLEPSENFKTLKKGETLVINITAEIYSVARCDYLPNWFIVADGLEPCLIQSTVGEDLKFVQPFDKPCQWKRFDYELANGLKRFDLYDPFTPEVRFEKHFVEDLKKPGKLIIPTPLNLSVEEKRVEFSPTEWQIVSDDIFIQEAEYLSEKSKVKIGKSGTSSKTIAIKQTRDLMIKNERIPGSSEGYRILVNDGSIILEARDRPGIFYACQSFLSLLDKHNNIPVCCIEDSPRYTYRGMHIDVSRNFKTKEDILKLLEIMAMYKLNKLHFHLTDDEGWRLEIPGLPELTQVGSKRGYSSGENTYILPVLGSGPFPTGSGTGYYSVSEYREILTYAAARHIEVIPEIDMPGHSHAAIVSMRTRYKNFMEKGQQREAEEYLLSDLSDKLEAKSVQMFAENSLNPGLESTFTFVEKVVKELKIMHADVNPLKTFHFGGDEVPYKAWKSSPACQALVSSGVVDSVGDLMDYFVRRVAGIVANYDLSLGAWQDGIMDDNEPCERSRFPNKEVYVYAWKNVWELQHAADSVKLANKGYKIVMSQGTHLYFDHPYEPDPEERGLYWACRYIDTRKVFNFMPQNLYANADYKLTGEVISQQDRKKMMKKQFSESLEKSENIIGVQGQLWTELVRTSEQFGEMIFPRLLSLAERGWYKAEWEDFDDDTERKIHQDKDWVFFANALGYKELQRLDDCDMAYYIPPPGARWLSEGVFETICCYPGLTIQYSTDNTNWTDYTQTVQLQQSIPQVLLKTLSTNRKRCSRIVVLKSEVTK
ncbi:hypothetical protein LOTGIDRAFT_236342 [Lottia gigantea]|uniref:beta-N-acetylhexosaminidase n=1 Tax=Lottia gigantea TaxID=225164 RepID=V3ZPJ1_LOTGI|nr:hypothetical protein LOTGIDRAFT_236342 [Lottia gigantea]ESO84390.1 hypothetical protein LOTGIDRAFT_236342 [Lottia gigantea]